MGLILLDDYKNVTHYYWGERTSTLDWCEENYIVSKYLAEFWNSLTNVLMIMLGICVIYGGIKHKMYKRFTLVGVGILSIGLGSFAFHATLKYYTQLLDELPMLYTSWGCAYLMIEYKEKLVYGRILPAMIIFLNIAVTLLYIWIENPIFHQVAFGAVLLFNFFKCRQLMTKIPDDTKVKNQLKGLLMKAFFGFLIAFIAWNIDNMCCTSLRITRMRVGPPADAFLQLHGWWHILTTYYTYCMVVFVIVLLLELKGEKRYYLSDGYLLPIISFNKTKLV